MDPVTTTPNPTGQTPTGEEKTGLTPTPNGQTPTGNSQQTTKTEISTLPPDIQDYIKSLRSEAEKANEKVKKDAEEAARQLQIANEAKLAEEKKWQELATARENRVKELEPVAARYTELTALVKTTFEAQVKDWPKEVVELLPSGEGMDILDFIKAVEKYRPLVAKLSTTQQEAARPKPGNVPNPPAAGNAPGVADVQARRAQRSFYQ